MKRDPAATARMRDFVQRVGARIGDMTHVPKVGPLDAPVFRALASSGVPFIVVGLVEHWPLARMTPELLVERFGSLRVKVRVGDYVKTAFTNSRSFVETTLAEFLDRQDGRHEPLPPYLGNQMLEPLAALCRWPRYFDVWNTPRIWLGPAGTVTPLHCDYVDNLFAQAWGRRRFHLCAPHHAPALRTWEANPVLFASSFDPEAPDFSTHPSATVVPWMSCDVGPGEMLYLPAGWFHRVRSLDVSLSANRWTFDPPLALSRQTGSAEGALCGKSPAQPVRQVWA